MDRVYQIEFPICLGKDTEQDFCVVLLNIDNNVSDLDNFFYNNFEQECCFFF